MTVAGPNEIMVGGAWATDRGTDAVFEMTPRANATDIDDCGRIVRLNANDIERVRLGEGTIAKHGGEMLVPIAAAWAPQLGGAPTVAIMGSHFNADANDPGWKYALPLGTDVEGRSCPVCGVRLGRHAMMSKHRETRSCRLTPRRRELAALGYVHAYDDALPVFAALGVEVLHEDTALIGYRDPLGGPQVFPLETWAPAWALAVLQARLGAGRALVNPEAHSNLVLHGLRDPDFAAAIMATLRMGGASAVETLCRATARELAKRGSDL